MLKARGIELVVFDMAGTVVDEGGAVYRALAAALEAAGVHPDPSEFARWHGASKLEVVRHFLGGDADPTRVDEVFAAFEAALEAAYFGPAARLAPMPGALACFAALRAAGILVALDTGYPRALADRLIERLALGPHVDGSIVSEEVGAGRPHPYMIHALLRRFGLADVRRVAKVGDTARDMEEGRNAGCGLVIGVLSGADGREALEAAGADRVLGGVAELEV